MPKRSERARVGDMLDAAREAVALASGRSRADLDSDLALRRALERVIEIVGEAAKNVPADTRARAPALPWREIAGMRDKVIHGYFEVDLNIVWSTVTIEIPALIPALEILVRDLSGAPGA